MKTGVKIGIAVGMAAALGCAFVHRRVIKAMIKHKPMPKAPEWHFWVTPEKRRKKTMEIKAVKFRKDGFYTQPFALAVKRV